LAYALFYFMNCRGHFFSGVLPICEKVNGNWRHVNWSSPFHYLGLGFLQFLCGVDFFGTTLLNVGAICFLVFRSQQIVREVRYVS
jgi:hypothetical protein